MACPRYCGIGIVFFIGMLYLTFAVDKSTISKNFMSTLNDFQLDRYKSIISERRGIYLTGYLLGLCLSALFIVTMSKEVNSIEILCITGAITFLTCYFYYILSPKQDLIVLQLDTRRQREEWSKVYKTMQFNYHIGLLLGIVSVILSTKAFKEGTITFPSGGGDAGSGE